MPLPTDHTAQRRRLDFAAAVRDRRIDLGLSQGQLADRAGCTRQSIVRIETATRSPSLDRLFVLAAALDLPLGDLFRAHEQPAGQNRPDSVGAADDSH